MPLDDEMTIATGDENADDRTLLVFGALLHDIGKVLYRGFSEQGTHSKLGTDFLKEEVGAHNPGYRNEVGDRIIEQVRYHHAREMTSAHLTSDSLAYITYFADNISAGMDRKNEGDDCMPAKFDRNAKLRKIFNILNGHHDDNTVEHEDYNVIRRRLLENLVAIPVSWSYTNSLLNLLEATCDSIPSSTNMSELVDVSLFDHSKTTAGIALCIFDYLNEKGTVDYRSALFDQRSSAGYYKEPLFLFCSLDMSGIQDFIYSISGNGALKQLRARSMYLELMMEHIIDELLERLHLCRVNLMYSGGGHSYLLFPNTSFVRKELKRFQEELTEWFVECFHTDLYLALAWIPCSPDDLANKGGGNRYSNLYRKLSRKMSERKASRYSAQIIRDLNFGEESATDRSRECTECHRSDLDIDSDGKCSLCADLGRISNKLVEKDVFVVSDSANGIGGSLPLPFDAVLSMWTRQAYLDKGPDARRVYTKNDWSTGLSLATHIWMGDYTFSVEDTSRRFSEYANAGSTTQADADGNLLGVRRLGVLRADVDNLGATFVYGIPSEKASISRSATLSRLLGRFFKSTVNDVLAAGDYHVQVIYSGGDDLFIVGNWCDVIHAGADIRRALDDFTGNGTLTLSAGIGIFDEHYPIASMAAETGELVDVAKLRRDSFGEVVKDAIALWSEDAVFGWSDFNDRVVPLLDKLHGFFDGNEKGRAFIYRLVHLLRDLDSPVSAPRLAYLLARSFEDDPEGDAKGKELYERAMDETERKWLVTALEWYVYETRERR